MRWWPLLLVLVGIVVALRGGRRARPERLTVNAARPPQRTPAKNAGALSATPSRSALGEYTQPAPGATVEVLPDQDD